MDQLANYNTLQKMLSESAEHFVADQQLAGGSLKPANAAVQGVHALHPALDSLYFSFVQVTQIENDFGGWLADQVKVLHSRQYELLDWDNLAEELEDMYANLELDLESDLIRVLEHLLKLQFEPSDIEFDRRARNWKVSVIEHRGRIATIVRKSKTLANKIPEFLPYAFVVALKKAATSMGIEESALPPNCPWNPDQICNLDFYPQRLKPDSPGTP
jgi:hypothetical protein